MNVLVACEESQRVCIEFRKLGHMAFSCDLQECSGGHPEWHIQGDVLQLLNGDCTFKTSDGLGHTQSGKWDLLIAFPPCTYLSNAGACRLFKNEEDEGEFKGINVERLKKGILGRDFFMQMLRADCKYICVENPTPSSVFALPPSTQAIQPYMFGHPYTKRTNLWLKNLPGLIPTNLVEPIGPWVCGNSEIWKKQAENGVVYGKEKDVVHRSKTFSGIASAMADQWSKYIESGGIYDVVDDHIQFKLFD